MLNAQKKRKGERLLVIRAEPLPEFHDLLLRMSSLSYRNFAFTTAGKGMHARRHGIHSTETLHEDLAGRDGIPQWFATPCQVKSSVLSMAKSKVVL